jgi:hypothetical protein
MESQMTDDSAADFRFSVPAKVVAESIERALASYPLEDAPVRSDWLRGQVSQSHDAIREAIKTEDQAVRDALKALEDLTRGRGAFRGRYGWLRLVLVLVGIVTIMVGLYSRLGWSWAIGQLHLEAAFGVEHNTGAVGVMVAGGSLLVLVVMLAAVRRQTFRPVIAAAKADLATKHAQRTEAIRVFIQEFVRAEIGTQVSSEQSNGALLYETDSSGLIETTAPLVVDSKNAADIERFVRDHTTSAIGIAGPRGCGKTTVIRRLTGLKSILGVYIQAPVYYEASDFVRLIHSEIAKKVLRLDGINEVMLDRRAARYGIVVRMFSGVATILLGVGVIFFGSRQAPGWMQENAFGTAGLAVVGIGLYMFISAYARALIPVLPRLNSSSEQPLIQLASDELRALRWKTSLQTKEKHSFKLLSAFTMDSEDQVGLDQRERSHPERVGDLRDFLLKLQDERGFPPVLVAIDELDKIASPEKAVDAVNGLKDLFHITDTHFVVSVSEDALDSFALRGVPVRDVFDSSFDTVMRIRPLTVTDSWELIGRRAPLFNEWAALLCHVIAGGLPRDLIRAARRCVDLCRANKSPLPIATLATQIVREETLEVIDAAIRRSRSDGTPSTWLMSTRRGLERSAGLSEMSPDTLFSSWGVVTQAGSTAGAAPEARLRLEIEANVGVFLLIMVTTAELFSVPRSPAEWREFAEKSTDLIERLAAARSAMAISRVDALDRLCDVRSSAGLTPVRTELVGLLTTVSSADPRSPAPPATTEAPVPDRPIAAAGLTVRR